MEISKTIKTAVKHNLPCLLIGEHGTGKSYSIKEEAQKQKKKLTRIILTQETTPEDLVCSYELKDGETILVKNALLTAVEKGEWICFEEMNMASPAVLTLLNGLIETDSESRYLRFQNLEIKPHKNFRLFATANPTNYSGANRMNDALLSRFLVSMVQPDYQKFLHIIQATYGEKVEKQCAKALSAICKVKENYHIYVSPRELLVYAQLRADGILHKDAVQLIIGRHYDLEVDILKDIVALFGVEYDRDNIRVMNESEIKAEVARAMEDKDRELRELTEKVNELEDIKKKYDAVRESFT